jgi:hypothetical protein
MDDNKNDLKESNNTNSSTNKGCMIALYIVVFALAFLFVKPMYKSYLRYVAQQREEESGILGAGLDRARYIIDEIQEMSPFRLEMLGEIKGVDYGMGLITMRFELLDSFNPLGLDLNSIKRNKDAAKEFIMTEIQAMPNNLRKAMNDIVKESFSLSFELSFSSSSNYTNITLEAYEIEKALQRDTNIDSQTMSLQLLSKSEKMFLPVQVDNYTFWTDTQLEDNALFFIYEIDDSTVDLNTIDKISLKQNMKSLYAYPQKPMERQIELCIKSGRSIGYKYIGTKTRNTFTVELTPSELQSISQ